MKNKIISNEKGAVLIAAIMLMSAMILTMMTVASFKLVEVSKEARRVNDQLRYLNSIEDLAQTLGRAFLLGQGTCPANTTLLTISGVNLCVPNTGITGAAGVTGICSDLDQDGTTTDRYCIQTLTLVTQNDLQMEAEKMIAKKPSRLQKIVSTLSDLVIASAHATCDWAGVCTTLVPDTPGATIPPPTAVLTVPAPFAVMPTGIAAQQSPSAVAVARNNAEPWSPNIAAWTPATANEIFTPNCNADNQYWLGCIRCQDPALAASANIICMSATICPPTSTKNPVCTVANRYTQMFAFFISDQNL